MSSCCECTSSFVDTLHVRFTVLRDMTKCSWTKAHVAPARHAEEYLRLAFRQPVPAPICAFFFEGVFMGAMLLVVISGLSTPFMASSS